MDPKIIDGKALAKKRAEILKKKLSHLSVTKKPTMVSFCNTEDPPSVKYTKMKQNLAEEIGINFITEEYTVNNVKEEIVEKVRRYNQDKNIDGIMFQMPLPTELYEFQKELLLNIDPNKDVDGLLEENIFLPATAKAVISILDEYVPNWNKKRIAIIGITGEVGRPLAEIFNIQSVDLVGINTRVGNLDSDLKDRDIIISATGKKDLIKSDMIKPGVVLIDVGLGDFEEGCFEKASLYTPIFGGVGPMTVISLMENVVESYVRRM